MSGRVHLINPSDLSFGVAVITPAMAVRARGGHRHRMGRPASRRRNARARSTSTRLATGDVVGIGIHTGNALRGYEIGRQCARARRVGRLRRHSRHAVSRRGARARRRARGRQGRRRHRLAARASRTASPAQPQRDLRRRTHRRRSVHSGALGPAAARTATCGRRCRPSAAARSTARSARCGAPTARSRGSAASIAVVREIVELRRLGFRFIALADDNFYPVTLEDLAMARRRADKTRLHELEALRARAVRADGAAGAAARRPGVLHADHDGSGRGHRVPRRHEARRTSAARSSASRRSRRTA